jgi:hypothetical protein
MMWATAGGGWRAMAAGMGVARSLHRAGALDDPSLKIASGNSGGAWFLSQFGTRPRGRACACTSARRACARTSTRRACARTSTRRACARTSTRRACACTSALLCLAQIETSLILAAPPRPPSPPPPWRSLQRGLLHGRDGRRADGPARGSMDEEARGQLGGRSR